MDSGKAAQRRAVTERLRRFFAALTGQLAAGTAEMWTRVERQITPRPRESASDASDDAATPPPPVRLPLREQPMQQQQQQKAARSDDDST